MKIVIIDGQGGRLGQLITEAVTEAKIDCELLVCGTNSIATSAMLKAGAKYGATGENPIVVASRDADIIVGPIGILAADSLFGEITPKMATAIGQSKATKLLLPVSHCNNHVIGVKNLTMNEMVSETINKIRAIVGNKQ